MTGFVSSGKWFHHFFGTLRHAPHQSGGDGIVTKRDLGGRLALLLAAMIWGSAFFVMKNAVDSIPTWMLLGIRFTMGAGVLALIFWKRLKLIRASTWARGAALGVLLCAAYGVQTFGLMEMCIRDRVRAL